MYATPYNKHFYNFLTDDSGKVCISKSFVKTFKEGVNKKFGSNKIIPHMLQISLF